MKEIFGATSRAKDRGDEGDGGLDESRAISAVSGDVKESVCNREQNLILPSTQSINRM